MRHRTKSSKTKCQHDMIPGLQHFLEKELEPLPFIKSIIPGEIKRTRSVSSSLRPRFQYSTPSGAKLLAHGPRVVQEVFIVTSNPDGLKDKIDSLSI